MSRDRGASRVARRRRARTIQTIVVAMFSALLVFGWWADHEGYVSWFGTACPGEGFVGPAPSFEELVSKYGLDPYCAREILGETWF